MIHPKRPQPWPKLKTERGPDLLIFQVRYDWLRNPRNQKTMKRLVLEANDWVNVVAITPAQEIVVVRQFRFGAGAVTTEIPGGLVDPGEDSKTAAMRELQEETGFTSTQWRYLGSVEPNPAFLENVCHQWLAEEAVQTETINLDEGEDIAVTTLSLDEIRAEIEAGHLRHSLALLSLSRVFDLWGRKD